MAGTMQEALKELAADNPDFANILDDAIEEIEKRKDQEDIKSALELTRAAREEEAKRREQEKEMMANNLPFAFLYHPMGNYSMVYAVILAPNYDVATEKAMEYLKNIQIKHKDDPDWKDLSKVFCSLKQMDLSSGISQVGYYAE